MGKTLKRFLFRVFCGFFLGVSIIAPGVSGSVMAVMMGIYEELIEIVSNPFKNLKKNILYLIPMGIGGVIAMILGVLLLDKLFNTYPAQARFMFMGLVLGGLPAMLSKAVDGGLNSIKNKKIKIEWKYIIAIVLAFCATAGVGIAARFVGANTSEFSLLYLCIAGGVAGICSMMPGMSVSMIFMMFGTYEFLMSLVSGLFKDFISVGFGGFVIPNAIKAIAVFSCFILGMILFSNVTKYVFDKHSKLAHFLVFGLMCGTITAIFPREGIDSILAFVGCFVMLIIGLFVSVLFVFLGKKFNVDEKEKTAKRT